MFFIVNTYCTHYIYEQDTYNDAANKKTSSNSKYTFLKDPVLFKFIYTFTVSYMIPCAFNHSFVPSRRKSTINGHHNERKFNS